MPKPKQMRGPKITLKRRHMLIHLPLMPLNILRSPIPLTARLLPTPRNKPHGPSRPIPRPLQQSKRLKNRNKPSSIIVGTSLGPSVPSVDVTAGEDYLLGVGGAFYLED